MIHPEWIPLWTQSSPEWCTSCQSCFGGPSIRIAGPTIIENLRDAAEKNGVEKWEAFLKKFEWGQFCSYCTFAMGGWLHKFVTSVPKSDSDAVWCSHAGFRDAVRAIETYVPDEGHEKFKSVLEYFYKEHHNNQCFVETTRTVDELGSKHVRISTDCITGSKTIVQKTASTEDNMRYIRPTLVKLSNWFDHHTEGQGKNVLALEKSTRTADVSYWLGTFRAKLRTENTLSNAPDGFIPNMVRRKHRTSFVYPYCRIDCTMVRQQAKNESVQEFREIEIEMIYNKDIDLTYQLKLASHHILVCTEIIDSSGRTLDKLNRKLFTLRNKK